MIFIGLKNDSSCLGLVDVIAPPSLTSLIREGAGLMKTLLISDLIGLPAGDVPLHLNIRETSDSGKPVVVSSPDSPEVSGLFYCFCSVIYCSFNLLVCNVRSIINYIHKFSNHGYKVLYY